MCIKKKFTYSATSVCTKAGCPSRLPSCLPSFLHSLPTSSSSASYGWRGNNDDTVDKAAADDDAG